MPVDFEPLAEGSVAVNPRRKIDFQPIGEKPSAKSKVSFEPLTDSQGGTLADFMRSPDAGVSESSPLTQGEIPSTTGETIAAVPQTDEAVALAQLPANDVPSPIGEEHPIELPRVGQPGTITRGVSDTMEGLVEWALNKPEEALATLSPLAPVIAAKYAPQVAMQFGRDVKAGLGGDREALGRALTIGALVGGPAAFKKASESSMVEGKPGAEMVSPQDKALEATIPGLEGDAIRQGMTGEKRALEVPVKTEEILPAATETLKEISKQEPLIDKGVTDASKVEEAAKIHGFLLRDAQEGKSPEALPVDEGQPGVLAEEKVAQESKWDKQAELLRNEDGDFEWIQNGEVIDTARDPAELIRGFHSDNAGYSTRVKQTSPDHFQMDLAEPIEGQDPVHELIPYDPNAKMRERLMAPSKAAPNLPEPPTAGSEVKEPAGTGETKAGPGMVGMGGALEGEVAAGAGADIHGIAQRVREQRAAAGQTEVPPTGQGISLPDSIERGRSLLGRGADPEMAMRAFEATKKLSADDVALVRAHGEALFKFARRVEEKFGTESEEYLRARKIALDWDARTKPMQTEWHKAGMAQQGATDIDTGSVIGLERAYAEGTGKGFTADQRRAAKEKVNAVNKAEAEAETAKAKVLDAAAKPPPEKPSISAYVLKVAEKWVKQWQGEAAKARKALAGKFLSPTPEDLLNLARIARADIAEIGLDFAKWSDRMVKEFGPKVKPYLENAWKKGQEMIEAMASKVADKEIGQKIKRAITKEVDPVKELWRQAKELIDSGVTDFDDLVHQLATSTGASSNQIREMLGKPKGAKRMTDEMYVKMAQRRRVVEQAKTWVKNQQIPGWLRFIRSVPRAFFIDKVFGHGTVGMITHAGLNVFHPQAWAAYWPAFFKQFKIAFSDAAHERLMQDLVRDPNYVTARRAGLVNDPFKYADDYQNAAMQNAFGRLFGKLAGGHGFDSLKLFRQARFNQIWNQLPEHLKTPEMSKMTADAINHATGVVKMPFREWTGWTFFAPKLEGSRWAWSVGDVAKAGKTFADWKKATPEERQFAMSQLKEKASIAGTYFALLAINQGLLKATGSDQKINYTEPKKGDFLAFKIAGHKLGVIGPMLGMVRLLANLVHSAIGKQTPLEKISGRQSEIAESLLSYGRGKLSPFAGKVADVATQADFQRRPVPWSSDKAPAYLRKRGKGAYTWPEYLAQEFTPIPVSEAIREVWEEQGMDKSAIETAMKALAVGVVAGGTGAKLSKDHPGK